MPLLSSSDLETARRVAAKLGVPIEWLINIVHFETARTFNPQIKNPNSSARGLIQFIDSTAKGLGYRDSLHLVESHPTFSSQLEGPVLSYFLSMRPFPTKQSFYMAVFYPKYRKVDPLTKFSENIQAVNPGIDTVQSYIDRVDGKLTVKQKGLGLLAIVGIMAYFMIKGKVVI